MSTFDAPRLCVVIPTYRRRSAVERALQALSRQTLPLRLFEVVVAIDGSDDGTWDFLINFQPPYRLRFAWQHNRGRAAACNLGASMASAELLLFLDDDMAPSPQCLEAHLRAHDSEAFLGIIGAAPIIVERGMPPAAKYMADKFNKHLERLASETQVLSLRGFYTGNFSIRRRDFQSIGGFDEDFSVYGNEDLELSIRLRRAGIRIAYNPQAIAWQHHTKRFAQIARDTINKGRTAVLLASKHPSALIDLQLSKYTSTSLKWRLARSGLLRISDRWSGSQQFVIRLIEQLEWVFARLPHSVYRLALDYFYWVGALDMLRENRARGHGLTILPTSR
jgi:validoxylamine A glucosyltransferase